MARPPFTGRKLREKELDLLLREGFDGRVSTMPEKSGEGTDQILLPTCHVFEF